MFFGFFLKLASLIATAIKPIIKINCLTIFTKVEIGKGQNSLPAETTEEIYIKIREMLTLATII